MGLPPGSLPHSVLRLEPRYALLVQASSGGRVTEDLFGHGHRGALVAGQKHFEASAPPEPVLVSTDARRGVSEAPRADGVVAGGASVHDPARARLRALVAPVAL